jgi:aspartyl-tRNA(Asn)/glutamyl-tRNA(Gln) amidotransferase subunit A
LRGRGARLAAEAQTKPFARAHAVGPLHGIPIVIKDLGEIQSEVAMGGTALSAIARYRASPFALHVLPDGLQQEIMRKIVKQAFAAWRNRTAPHTAMRMRRPTAAGIIHLGKTHMVEFAYAAGLPTSVCAHRGTPGISAHTALRELVYITLLCLCHPNVALSLDSLAREAAL